MANGHLDWCLRENYLELLDDFRKGKIKTFEFSIRFENIGKLTSDIIDMLESNLIILSPNEKSLGFSNLLEEVFETCQDYLEDADFRDENSESEFKNYIEEMDVKIQNFLKEE
jgi:GTP-sensing pleiotropic transcriptional regulator CodY